MNDIVILSINQMIFYFLVFKVLSLKGNNHVMNDKDLNNLCDVCGALVTISNQLKVCQFCKFEKVLDQDTDKTNQNLIFAENINQYFKDKYLELEHGDTFELKIPVNRFYKNSTPQKGQVNFFKSKNIMFLLEQHGFQMVSRKSRFSNELNLIVRKI